MDDPFPKDDGMSSRIFIQFLVLYPSNASQSVLPVANQRFSVRGVCCLRQVCGLKGMSFFWSRNGNLRVATKRSGPCGCRRSFTIRSFSVTKSEKEPNRCRSDAAFPCTRSIFVKERRQPQGPLRFVATRRLPFRDQKKLIPSYVDVYCARSIGASASYRGAVSSPSLPRNPPGFLLYAYSPFSCIDVA